MREPVYRIGVHLVSMPGATERQRVALRDDVVMAVFVRQLPFGAGRAMQFVTARELPAVIAELQAA